MSDQPPRGLIANMVTPLDAEGRPDGEVLTRLMNRLRSDVQGFLVGSVKAGEALQMTLAERLGLFKTARRACGPEKALFFEITAFSEDETRLLLELAETELESHPGDTPVFFLLTPLLYRGNRDLPGHVAELAGQSSRPFLIGNNPELVRRWKPGLKHKNIRTSVMKRLGTIGALAGMEFGGDLDRMLNYQRALQGRRDFLTYDGGEWNFLSRPSSSGLISCGVNILPGPWSDVVGSSLGVSETGRFLPDQLDRLWRSGRTARESIPLYRHNPPAALKAMLAIMELIPRKDTLPGSGCVDYDQMRALQKALGELGLI